MNDKIEKTLQINAPVSRVWEALTDYKKFSEWFKAELQSPFAEGKTTEGFSHCSGTKIPFALMIQKIKPQTYFSYKWTPCPMDASRDYSKEAPTLVEFTLEKTATGTLLRVTESGFENLPADRRAEAFRMNDGGWTKQMENIQNYVE